MPLLNRWQPAQFAARQSATEPPVVGEGVSEVLDLYEATRFEDDGDALERATAKIEVLWAADNDPVEAVAIWLNDEHSARETTLMMMALGSVARAHADRSEAMELLLLRALQSERAQDRLAATFGAEASRWPRAIKALERAAQSEPIGYIAGLQKRIVELLGDGESRARLVSTQA